MVLVVDKLEIGEFLIFSDSSVLALQEKRDVGNRTRLGVGG